VSTGSPRARPVPSLADFLRGITETVFAMHGLADDLLARLGSSDPPLSRVKLLLCFLASKRVVSFNWEVFGLPHSLHRVDGGRAGTSIFRLARDHRVEAPNRRNAHNNGAYGYDSCSYAGAPFKTNMSASVRFQSCLPVPKNFE
jgi:hypothetical protein